MLKAGKVFFNSLLELENNRLKKLVAERDLDIEVMREISAKNGKPGR